tara:strand:+ start:1151 stop:2263 length:1113 start_codon:yes stop_codon:yes gene_type:complete
MSTDFSFSSVFTYNGSSYTDVTLEAQSPAGTSFSVLGGNDHFLYLGHASKFDMALFDLDAVGSVGIPKWEYTNGSGGWTEFIPGSGRRQIDPDDNEGAQWKFDKDGAERFPTNLLDSWSTLTVNSANVYWVRASTASFSTAPTIKRIQMRPLAAYCSTKDVFELMQLGPVLGGTDFGASTTPTKDVVERFIQEAQSYIDHVTRKSWRPNAIYNEYHEFNLQGFKLDRPDPYKIVQLAIWNGADWQAKTQGRKSDFFLVAETGMIHFSRYFLLPARFQSYNAPVWKWGAGEFTMPLKIDYFSGRDLGQDTREGGIVIDAAKKLAAIDITRSADFGGAVVSGMDRVQLAQRLDGWKIEIDEQLESLRAFELF